METLLILCTAMIMCVVFVVGKKLLQSMHSIPEHVLGSINGSVSNQKGKLGELIAYLNLKGSYDRVLALGSIVDFVGIRFSKNGEPGAVDFIDIKNGRSARLSHDQKELLKLIKNQQIHFIKVQVETDVITADTIKSDS